MLELLPRQEEDFVLAEGGYQIPGGVVQSRVIKAVAAVAARLSEQRFDREEKAKKALRLQWEGRLSSLKDLYNLNSAQMEAIQRGETPDYNDPYAPLPKLRNAVALPRPKPPHIIAETSSLPFLTRVIEALNGHSLGIGYENITVITSRKNENSLRMDSVDLDCTGIDVVTVTNGSRTGYTHEQLAWSAKGEFASLTHLSLVGAARTTGKDSDAQHINCITTPGYVELEFGQDIYSNHLVVQQTVGELALAESI